MASTKKKTPATTTAKVAANKKPKPGARKKTSRAAKVPRAPEYGPRADLGAPIAGFFAKQPDSLRPVLEELRKLIEEAAPEAASAIKWGMPFFTIDGAMMCALGGHKSHVNLILSGPPGTYADPDGLLSGEGKTGRHLKVKGLAELPRSAVRTWLRTAARAARKKA